MKYCLSINCCVILVAAAMDACGAPDKVLLADIDSLLRSRRPAATTAASTAAGKAQPVPELPQFTKTPAGYLESLSAAPGMEFPAVAGPAGQPEVTAKNFLKAHGKLFGILSPAVDFKLRKKNRSPGKHSIRLTQTYNGIPVFGGEMVMQVNEAGGVEYVAGNFDRDTGNLDEKRLATTPTLLAAEASAAAQAHYAPQAPGQVLAVTPPELTLFVPALLKLAGPKRLTWKLEVQSADEHTVSRRVFIDAHSGEFVQDIPLIHDALSRNISDGNFTAAIPGTIVRTEGAAPSENEEADAAYDFLGDTYNFFFTHFQRDGITNNGAALNATVRHREDPNVPFSNAYWSPFLCFFRH